MLAALINDLGGVRPHNDTELVNRLIREYASTDIFREVDAPFIPDNPFRRPLLNKQFQALDLDRPLDQEGMHSNASLIANRVLLSIYERDFVMLPAKDLASKRKDFETFYSERLRSLGEMIRPHLERYLFGWVERGVEVSGTWTLESFQAYFNDFKARFQGADNQKLMNVIMSAKDPVAAGKMYLIQLAGDFLVESSAMSRNVLGHYGPLQSALFKVVIDEYGYGVHETKHSTLFQKVLRHCGLDPVPHAYWQHYLPGALYLNNFYNYICKSHSHLFRYLGAILQVETAFRITCRQMAEMMRSAFGSSAEIDYFTEHVHIDDHHSRMVMETLVIPAARQYGDSVLTDVVRGFEESLLVGQVGTTDLMRQLTWADAFTHQGRQARAEDGPDAGSGRWTGSIIRDADTVYRVESGRLDIVSGHENAISFRAGESARVPRGRLHALMPSAGCVFEALEAV